MSRAISPGHMSTVVSIVPFKIEEIKPGIYPGHFIIPPSKNNEPVVLHVGESIYHVEVDENRSLPVRCPSYEVARSIVQDYVTSNLCYESALCSPGVMWVEGVVQSNEVKTKFPEELEALEKAQYSWFIKLVRMADDDWEKTGRHQSISDFQRHAARSMNLERPWLIDQKTAWDAMTGQKEMIKCVSCQSMVSRLAVVCPHCKLIMDAEKYSKMKFAVSETK